MLIMFSRGWFWLVVIGTVFEMLTIHPAKASDSPTSSISLEREVHFLTPGGEDILIRPSSYQVEVAEGWLRLISGPRRDALLIQAHATTHDNDLNAPQALSVSDEEADQHQILLLLPGGTGWEAMGSYSGLRSRGVRKSIPGSFPKDWYGVYRADTQPTILSKPEESWEAFLQAGKTQVMKHGRRLIDFETYTTGNRRYFVGVFEKGKGSNIIERTKSLASFKNLEKKKRQEGLALVDFERYAVGNTHYYVGVWRTRVGREAPVWIDHKWKGFQTNQANFTKKRFTLIDFEYFRSNGKDYYVHIYRGNKAPQPRTRTQTRSGRVHPRSQKPKSRIVRYKTYQAFVKEFAELFKKGLRLSEFEPYQVGGSRYYLAVYEPGTGGNILNASKNRSEFYGQRSQYGQMGLKLIDIEVIPLPPQRTKPTHKRTQLPQKKGKPIKWPKLDGERPGLVVQNAIDFSDRCVPNVMKQIETGLNRGKTDKLYLAYRSGGHGAPILENNSMGELPEVKVLKRIRRLIRLRDAKHRQGIVRYFDRSTGRNYFYVSSSTFKHPGYKEGLGTVEIVQWGNQSGRSGPLGSNINNERDRPPGSSYSVVGLLEKAPGSHAGGMQIMGRFLVVPFYGLSGNPDALSIYDLQDPKRPKQRTLLKAAEKNGGSFGNASLARMANGRYLLLGLGGGKITPFVSKGTSFPEKPDEWTRGRNFSPGKLWAAGGDSSPPVIKSLGSGYQNTQLVADCNGELFILGTHNSHKLSYFHMGGKDYIDIWKVTLQEIQNGDAYDIHLKKVGNRHMYCGKEWCNFNTGASVYIDPMTGNLSAYATEYYNEGPKVNGIRSTKIKEFRQHP